MFLFCADPDLVDVTRLVGNPQRGWDLRSIRSPQGLLAWDSNTFTKQTHSNGILRLEIGDHAGGEEPVCIFEWNLNDETIRFSRRWSGEFAIKYAVRPCAIVTSNLTFAAEILRRRVALTQLQPDRRADKQLRGDSDFRITAGPAPKRIVPASYAETLKCVRERVTESVKSAAADSRDLLLSGGVDSSVIAAVAKEQGIRLRAFTFAVRSRVRQDPDDIDLKRAIQVAAFLDIPHTVIGIRPSTLRRNVPRAVQLAETCRGTIVDELAAHVEVARFLSSNGVRRVLTGEGADDLFGAFPSALRFFAATELKAHLRKELIEGLPDELALVQAIYSPGRIRLVHPFWTPELRAIGYHLPLRYRIDRSRLMKRVLRDAFRDLLPEDICLRPKGVPRECTPIRRTLEEAFGNSRERYRDLFRNLWAGKR
jgi:hypothetical protein